MIDSADVNIVMRVFMDRSAAATSKIPPGERPPLRFFHLALLLRACALKGRSQLCSGSCVYLMSYYGCIMQICSVTEALLTCNVEDHLTVDGGHTHQTKWGHGNQRGSAQSVVVLYTVVVSYEDRLP